MFNINIHIYKQFLSKYIVTEKECEQSNEGKMKGGGDVDVFVWSLVKQKNWFRC